MRTVRLAHRELDFTVDLDQPLVHVAVAGQGSNWSGDRAVETAVGARLVCQRHELTRRGQWHELRVDLRDPETGLTACLVLDSPDGVAVVRSRVVLTNTGSAPLTVTAVTSLVHYGLTDGSGRLDGLDLHWADSDWLAECRWQRRPLRELVVDLNRAAHQHGPRGSFGINGRGSWSTGRYLPMGALVDRVGGRALAWQVESSAGWRWEVGERAGAGYLALLGPTDEHHQWNQTLAPGQTFTSVPVALARSAAGFDGAVAELTRYRRLTRRPHRDHQRLPVIFNDYMNTIMGDPTTAKLLPLIDAAARAGAEYFCVDAGWYDDDATGWWDSVGAWQPSTTRFPGGIDEVLTRIRDHGMVPGLWLEPEVVGVRSPVADALPDEAFFRRHGVRVVEHGRFQLDLRHPAARAHLDRVVDRLVGDHGVGYLKLDYNINIGAGTDAAGQSAGAGLLGHVRAYHDWLDAVLDRHPDLVIENCASGGMRMDHAMLARTQLQSTSDQQDFLRYPPIAASAPTALTPEQSAVWAYPQPRHTTDEIAFILAGALLGRVHLSGFLDRMDETRFGLVRQAIQVYHRVRGDLRDAVPFWPLGLPAWTDPWLVLGMRSGDTSYLTVWRRPGGEAGDTSRALRLAHLSGRPAAVEILYPVPTDASVHWHAPQATLTVQLPRTPTAVLVRIRAT